MNTSENVNDIKAALEVLALPEKAAFYPKFFKAGKGQYAEGDVFIGVTVPEQRKIAQFYADRFSLDDISQLIQSPVHEHRLTSLLILVKQFEKTKNETIQKDIISFYLKHIPFINNWDLVDTSCYKILGRYCFEHSKDEILIELAESDNLWRKRIAVVSTMQYVKKGSFSSLKKLALLNLKHSHDLMHKANGWLLREMGKVSEKDLLEFLNQYYHDMPRTTLRYAIEKLDEETRQNYLKGRV